MPSDHGIGRASKACDSCRRQKTRCYTSSSGACLRCETLQIDCSLYSDQQRVQDISERPRTRISKRRHTSVSSSTDRDGRILALERTIASLARRVGVLEGERQPSVLAEKGRPNTVTTDHEQPPAPVVLLRAVAKNAGIASEPAQGEPITLNSEPGDFVAQGFMSVDTALSLSKIFHERYGHWIALSPDMAPETALSRIRQSRLLFCACCLVAARHVDENLDVTLAGPMFRQAKQLLAEGTLQLPQPLDFFRAVVVMSLWSTSVGSSPLSLGWLLSGIALQHSSVSDLFVQRGPSPGMPAISVNDLEAQCVWNHLCLSHLHHCVGTGRKASVDRNQIDTSRRVLSSDNISNFEVRIVAELYLYWTMYEQCCAVRVSLPEAQIALTKWTAEWSFLFNQPRATFLEMGLHFANLVAYDRSLRANNDTARVRESLLSEMVRLSKTVMTLAMDTTDDRTKHLSDHIYHLIAFAAVTLCRLLHNYGEQLSAQYNLSELDDLIMNLASWLHCIGPSRHIAHTFGDIVAAYHKKLRPNAMITSPTSSYEGLNPSIDVELASLFPGFLPIDSGDWPAVDPALNWQSLANEY